MKFTKLTSSVLAGATLLSILAPTATFAATSTAGSQGATDDNGGTPLPMTDKTVAGISFGDNSDNGNTGYLRLQMVPHTLDFGNHKLLNNSKRDFTADGKNTTLASNDLAASYDNTDANKTRILNTTDPALSKVENKAWATVVDKQITRTGTGYAATTTPKSGSWELSVKSDDALTAVDSAGNKTSETITGAKLSFDNTAYGRTQKVFELTKDANDASWATDSTAAGVTADDTDISAAGIVKSFGTVLKDNGTDVTVATAADGEGQGANVFGWAPQDIKLTMPQGAQVNNAIYKANLTWTLSSTAA
ncbi:cell surface protein [Latilactobacillus curvatus]|uniref:Cell surface protein n=1 Tax=Latilactobacillus curvatus TaxID=28038 RepID=A0AAC9UU99_LATCU|nr:WxL domain-containing protein [Latilactobacillus curvatus]ASN60950.1 cell surface protein [Latilactobacillus curvatus]